MRVMHFHFGKDGGAERFFVHLLNALAARGVEQKIVIRPGRGWKSSIDGSVEIIESHFRTFSMDRMLLPLKVKALARRWQPNGILGWMPKGAKLMPDLREPIKLVRLGDYPTTLKKFRNIDVVVGNTPGIVDHVRSMGWQRGLKVISNFTALEKVEPVDRAVLDTPKDAHVVVSMGRFVPRKGFDVLVRALQRLPQSYLWLLGDGEQEANLRQLAQSMGVIDRVRFAGWQADPRPFIAAADCFAMASSHEPLGNVILEAWAQDVPVVSTRSEGPSWFMTDGGDGLMVAIGDDAGFAEAIGRLRDDGALRQHVVAGGRRTLEAKFSEDAIARAYMDLLSTSPAIIR